MARKKSNERQTPDPQRDYRQQEEERDIHMVTGGCSPSLAWCVAWVVFLCSSWQAALSFGNNALFKGTAGITTTAAARSTKDAATAAAAVRRHSRECLHAEQGSHAYPRRRGWAYDREAVGSDLSGPPRAGKGAGSDGGGEDDAGAKRGVKTGFDNSLLMERPIERVVLPEGRGLRVHCMSDLHTDVKANLAW